MTTTVTIAPPTGPLRGRVGPPGSKSITNRALLLAALAEGRCRITGALKSDDTRHMASALRAMGVAIDEPDGTTFTVASAGRLEAPAASLFLGNAGTATRFLTAAAALVQGRVVITGDAHMQRRPIAPLVEALRALGVALTAPTGCPPITVDGRGSFDGDAVAIDASLSSQYVSAILMLAPAGTRAVRVSLRGSAIGARGYVDLTVSAMRRFGAVVEQVDDGTWLVQPGRYRPCDLHVEPDASAATYLWAAAALTGGDIDIGVRATDFTQPDAAAFDLIASFPHLPAVIDGAQMQDAIPTLAVLAAFGANEVRFTGIANLRVKECDRIAALATEMSRLSPGLATEDGDDLVVAPMPLDRFRPAQIETYADHRIAMSMALAGLRAPGVTIRDAACVAKTYPNYWSDLETLGLRIHRA